jgi:hypothetical protein
MSKEKTLVSLDQGQLIPMNSNNEQGQSTIEFILTFAFGVSIIILIFNSAMGHVTGYLVHYATFMASRTYLSSESYNGGIGSYEISYQDARNEATQVFNRYNYLAVGAVTTYERTVDLMGLVTGARKMTMISESFLGKEPTRSVCATRVCESLTGGSNCVPEMDITLYDDGC